MLKLYKPGALPGASDDGQGDGQTVWCPLSVPFSASSQEAPTPPPSKFPTNLVKQLADLSVHADGGPAFPTLDGWFDVPDSDGFHQCVNAGGMSLRDWFAGQAVSTVMFDIGGLIMHKDRIVRGCYDLAEEMLIERARRLRADTERVIGGGE